MKVGRVAKISLAIVFVALLATPLVLKRLAARREAAFSSPASLQS